MRHSQANDMTCPLCMFVVTKVKDVLADPVTQVGACWVVGDVWCVVGVCCAAGVRHPIKPCLLPLLNHTADEAMNDSSSAACEVLPRDRPPC